jgi:hypothetical protein
MNTSQDILASLLVMRMQEETSYAIAPDYLHQHQPPVNIAKGPLGTTGLPVDAECRFKMAEWKHQVIDFCKFQRETAAISMSYLDRFLATPGGVEARNNRKIFQLAAMACLYTSIKINEPEAVDPKTVAGLSRGAHTEQQVEAMERKILGTLDWRLHPPTALSFCHSFLALLPQLVDEEKEAVLELAKFQTELAVSEYYFVGTNPSTIAFAAIVNAFQSLNTKIDVNALEELAEKTGINLCSKKVHEVKEKLYQSIILTSVMPTNSIALNAMSKTVERNRASPGHVSPRGVNHEAMDC